MLVIDDIEAWNRLISDILARYSEPLLRLVAGSLFKIKIGQSAEDLIERSIETLGNPPVIDRRLRDLPDPARQLLSLIGMSRQPFWRVGQLISLSAAIGHPDGLVPIKSLLEAGLLVPKLDPNQTLEDLDAWLTSRPDWSTVVFCHPIVATRVRQERLFRIPNPLTWQANDSLLGSRVPKVSDGLEWPLRLAVIWQQVRRMPIRLTLANQLFKRDWTRLQADPVLSTPFVEVVFTTTDAAILAVEWSMNLGLLAEQDGEQHAVEAGNRWSTGLWPTLIDLYAAFFPTRNWDPLIGQTSTEGPASVVSTAGLLLLVLMASEPSAPDGEWWSSDDLARWLWEHDTSWVGSLSRESQKAGGVAWVDAFLLGVAFPLCLVEVIESEPRRYRLTAFGKHVLYGTAVPPPVPAYPQTLLVQPNAEVLVYRQGLTPQLIAQLSRFATWKKVGPACTLELNADEMNLGLQGGCEMAQVMALFDRHGMRPLPANVADLIRRWANKRERITLYPSATLVEFATSEDLDSAIARGLVTLRLTDRIGMTADGSPPNFSQLRLISNRDYDGTPQQCVSIANDGVSMQVDATASDLLLDAEILRIAEPRPSTDPAIRRYFITPESIRKAFENGTSIEDLESWCMARTGKSLPPAARLLLSRNETLTPRVAKLLVLTVKSAELADGLIQWPNTSGYFEDRLGPTSLVVAEENLAGLTEVLASLGITLTKE